MVGHKLPDESRDCQFPISIPGTFGIRQQLSQSDLGFFL
jgi:hypothetical protein